MSSVTRAERLAAGLEAIAGSGCDSVAARMCCGSAAAELRRLAESERALLEVLESYIEDSEAAIDDHVAKYGEICRAERLAAMRAEVQRHRALIAATKEARNG